VKALNVIKYICFGYIHCPVFLSVHTFPLEHSEKSFAGCIITTMTNSAHEQISVFRFRKF